MKHTEILVAISLMTAVASCNGHIDPVIPDPTPGEKEIYLGASIDAFQTKTSLTIEGKKGKTNWEIGDVIKIYSPATSIKPETFVCDSRSESDPSVGRFFAVSGVSDYTVGGEPVAYYPGDKLTAYDTDTKTMTASVPAVQTFVAGTFGPGAAPMVSNVYVSDDKTFRFRNVFGGVIIPLYSAYPITVTKIELTSAVTYLAGDDFKFVLSGDNGFTVTQPTANASKTISMNMSRELSITKENATNFCFMLPGLGENEKVTVKITTGSGEYTKSFTTNKGTVSNPNVLTANNILSLGTLRLGKFDCFDVNVDGWDDGGTVNIDLE